MRPARRKRQAEPTIALINIVFLMLVFFMVAGTLAQPLDGSLELVETRDLEGRAPPDALVLDAQGQMRHGGRPVDSAAAFVTALPRQARESVRVVPDRAVPAARLVAVARELQDAGAGAVLIVTQRALE